METQQPTQCGKFRCWMISFAVLFFVLAAACEFEAAYYAHSRTAGMVKALQQSSITPMDIRMGIVASTQDRGFVDGYSYAGWGLMMLGFACALLGGRFATGSHEA